MELGVAPVEKAKAAEPAKPSIRSGPPPARRVEFWKAFYAKRDESPEDLFETVKDLRAQGDMTDVEAVLGGYLYSKPDRAEPWMFGALVTTIEINKGGSERVKGWLDYCTRLAEKSGNPNMLLYMADLWLLHGGLERVGPLLDATAEKVPHRAEPHLMALQLARKALNPERMGGAAETLLALGWPGADEAVRREVRTESSELARSLRAKGRNEEAAALLARVAAAEPRDLIVRLTWTGDADLDLEVEEPLGAAASLKAPRTVFGGALIRNGRGRSPEEIYVCPRGFDGEYVVRVDPVYNDPERPVERATVEATLREGRPDERKQTWTVTLARPEPIVIRLEGGRRREILPYTATAGPPIEARTPRLRPGPLLRPSPLLPKPSLPRLPAAPGSTAPNR